MTGAAIRWLVQCQPIGAKLANGQQELLEIHRLADVAVGAEPVALDKVAVYDDYEILPGHGYRFTGLADRRAERGQGRKVSPARSGDPRPWVQAG